MAVSPEQANETFRSHLAAAVGRVEEFIDGKLVLGTNQPGTKIQVALDSSFYAVLSMSWSELFDRLATAYRKAGWIVRDGGAYFLTFEVPAKQEIKP